MDNLKKKYDEITELRSHIIEEMKVLEENEIIKRYFELKNKMKAYILINSVYYYNERARI